MREGDPFVLGDDAHEILLDFFGIGVAGEVQPVGEAHDVSVDDDARSDAEGCAEDDVGRFSGYARQGEQLLHGAGNLAGELLDDLLAGALNGFGLGAEKSGGADFGFDLARVGVGEIFGLGILREERGSDQIDAHVGGLRGKNRGDQQLKWIVVNEGAGGRGVGFVELLQDGADALGVGTGGLGGGMAIFGGGRDGLFGSRARSLQLLGSGTFHGGALLKDSGKL